MPMTYALCLQHSQHIRLHTRAYTYTHKTDVLAGVQPAPVDFGKKASSASASAGALGGGGLFSSKPARSASLDTFSQVCVPHHAVLCKNHSNCGTCLTRRLFSLEGVPHSAALCNCLTKPHLLSGVCTGLPRCPELTWVSLKNSFCLDCVYVLAQALIHHLSLHNSKTS